MLIIILIRISLNVLGNNIAGRDDVRELISNNIAHYSTMRLVINIISSTFRLLIDGTMQVVCHRIDM